jgi:uncharacterized membrane protein YesL
MLHPLDDFFSLKGQLEVLGSFISFIIACYYCVLSSAVFNDRCKISTKTRAIFSVCLLLAIGTALALVILGGSDLFYFFALVLLVIVGGLVTYSLIKVMANNQEKEQTKGDKD